MGNVTIQLDCIHINLSPYVFRLSAQEYFKCYLDYIKPGKFSAVPFFLCCRAIELALKAKHLESKSQSEVKKLYCHDLLKLYYELDTDQQILLTEELELLKVANKIYKAKEFEYLNVFDTVSAYKGFPDLNKLGALT
jgi:hypothetical protein